MAKSIGIRYLQLIITLVNPIEYSNTPATTSMSGIVMATGRKNNLRLSGISCLESSSDIGVKVTNLK